MIKSWKKERTENELVRFIGKVEVLRSFDKKRAFGLFQKEEDKRNGKYREIFLRKKVNFMNNINFSIDKN